MKKQNSTKHPRKRRKNPSYGKSITDDGFRFPSIEALGMIMTGLSVLFPGVRQFMDEQLNKPVGPMVFGPDYPVTPPCDHLPEDKLCPRNADGSFLHAECRHYGHVPGMCHRCVCMRGKTNAS